MTPTDVRGIIYRSIAETALDQGVNQRTIYKHLNAGTMNMVGVQQRTPPRPCEFDGIHYPSLKAASVALGITVEGVRQR